MNVRQGDLIWVDFGVPIGSQPGYQRPAVVVQCDLFNKTALNTCIVAAVTTNLRLGDAPGNVRLARGEAKLAEPSVVNVTSLTAVDQAQIVRTLGTLSKKRIREVLDGVALVLFGDTL